MYPVASWSAKLDATDELLLSGLRRTVARAGMAECDRLAEAALSVRSHEAGCPHPAVDIEVSASEVVVRLRGEPARGARWSAYAVLEALYECGRVATEQPEG